jgi:hypothetical protein
VNAGDLIFSRWNGWDDRLIAAVQWVRSRFTPALRPYWQWTHVQVADGTGGYYEAWKGGVCHDVDAAAHNTAANGLLASTPCVLTLTNLERQAALAFADACLGQAYDWLAFIWSGIQMLALPWVTLALVRRRMCSGLAAGSLEHAGVLLSRDARTMSPMHLAAAYGCRYAG